MKALITNEFIRKCAEKTGEILEHLCRKTEEMNIVRIVLCQGFLLLGCITFSSSFYGTDKIFQAESAVRGLSFFVLCLAFFGGSDLLRKAGALIYLLGTLLLIGERLVYWQGNYEIVNGLIEYHWMSGPDVFLLYFLAKT
ncbi:MAG: hypothetical protein II712_05620, partial [Erysipelotrichaceae bacterium]|nr:hypothetical protein [Erysipelotrichaceae bacterium]